MKKIYFAILVLLLAAVSCNKELSVPEPQVLKDHVTLNFSIPGVPATKGVLGENPDIQDIHVAVFGTSGYLQEYNLATINETSHQHTETIDGEQVTHTDYSYSVSLPLYDGSCTLHFIANGPQTIPFGNETTIMSALASSRGSEREDAYWQTRVLEDGIPYDKDVFNSQRIIQLPANFAADNNLNHIPLIRNFAKLTVSVDTDRCTNFTLTGFTVINEPLAGSVAPYNSETSSFVENYETYDYADLKALYPGYIPASAALDESVPDSDEAFQAEAFPEGTFAYIYERPSSSRKPLHLIMKGDYTDENNVVHYDRYYKINVLDGGAVAAFFRNMQYDIIITGVAQIGSDSPDVAEANISSVDVTSEIFQELPSYQEGNSSIYVEYTSATYVQAGVHTLKFRYIEDGENHNDLVSIALGEGSALSGVSVISTDDGSDDDGLGGWGTISYTVGTPGALAQTQIIKVIGGALNRDVRITLMGPQTMTLSLDPASIMKVTGTPTKLYIGIPLGLPLSMFPLNLEIESDRLSLSPQSGEQLPVVTGPSIVPSKNGQNSFHYVKALDRSAYNALVEEAEAEGIDRVYLELDLQSNVAESACNIYVANKYFNTNSVYLGNYDPGHFTNLYYDGSNVVNGKIVEGEDLKLNFKFTMDKSATGPVYLALTNLMLDPDYPDDLTNLTVSGGKNIYQIGGSTAAGTHTVHLITTSATAAVNAELSSFHFEGASLAAERKRLDFGAHGFNNTDAYLNIGERALAYTFNYNSAAVGESVIVSVYGGSIDTAADSRFSQTSDGDDGAKRYVFTPSDSKANQTFNVQSSFAQAVTVKLEAPSYEPVQDTKARAIIFPAESLTLNMQNRYNVSLRTLKNGQYGSAYTFSTTRNGSYYTNSSSITIPISDSDNFQSTDYVNFRYSTGWYGSTYNGYSTLQNIAQNNGNVYITFS